ncbi:MAG: hypothetical protein A2Z29_11290 [Chloroflexi bacterium RBG_16_56_11]|nr:MAG: hypothetical protein A2Z29_11290 [Chloroflexi bacterium RBG_16_56_11]HJX13679.1 hypothetical protein [Dehalococcoidales bacterium]
MKKALFVLMALPVLLAVPVTPVAADESFSYELNVGRDEVDVGGFTVTISGSEATFALLIDDTATDWRLDEMHLYVGDTPPAKSAPGRFPYKHQDLGGTLLDEFVIDLSEIDLDGDEIVYVAAHARLVMQSGVDGADEPVYVYETTWAQGEYPIGKGANWATYFELELDQGGEG